jgi:hypothetical protein
MSAKGAPLYARVLRLRRIRVGGLASFLFVECAIAAGILLALAELVSWWAVPLLPLLVAAVVKVNDMVGGVGTMTSERSAPRVEEVPVESSSWFDDDQPERELAGALPAARTGGVYGSLHAQHDSEPYASRGGVALEERAPSYASDWGDDDRDWESHEAVPDRFDQRVELTEPVRAVREEYPVEPSEVPAEPVGTIRARGGRRDFLEHTHVGFGAVADHPNSDAHEPPEDDRPITIDDWSGSGFDARTASWTSEHSVIDSTGGRRRAAEETERVGRHGTVETEPYVGGRRRAADGADSREQRGIPTTSRWQYARSGAGGGRTTAFGVTAPVGTTLGGGTPTGAADRAPVLGGAPDPAMGRDAHPSYDGGDEQWGQHGPDALVPGTAHREPGAADLSGRRAARAGGDAVGGSPVAGESGAAFADGSAFVDGSFADGAPSFDGAAGAGEDYERGADHDRRADAEPALDGLYGRGRDDHGAGYDVHGSAHNDYGPAGDARGVADERDYDREAYDRGAYGRVREDGRGVGRRSAQRHGDGQEYGDPGLRAPEQAVGEHDLHDDADGRRADRVQGGHDWAAGAEGGPAGVDADERVRDDRGVGFGDRGLTGHGGPAGHGVGGFIDRRSTGHGGPTGHGVGGSIDPSAAEHGHVGRGVGGHGYADHSAGGHGRFGRRADGFGRGARGAGGHDHPGYGAGAHDHPGYSAGGHDHPSYGAGGHDHPGYGAGGHDYPGRSTGGYGHPHGAPDHIARDAGGHDEAGRGTGAQEHRGPVTDESGYRTTGGRDAYEAGRRAAGRSTGGFSAGSRDGSVDRGRAGEQPQESPESRGRRRAREAGTGSAAGRAPSGPGQQAMGDEITAPVEPPAGASIPGAGAPSRAHAIGAAVRRSMAMQTQLGNARVVQVSGRHSRHDSEPGSGRGNGVNERRFGSTR